jgi:hypothetical protein
MTFKSFPGNIRVGSSAGAAQPATVLSRTPPTVKSKYPKKASGGKFIVEGKKEKRAT